MGQCDGEQSELGDGYKENKVIENTMGEPGDGEQSGQGCEEYSCKDNTEFVYNVCITYYNTFISFLMHTEVLINESFL